MSGLFLTLLKPRSIEMKMHGTATGIVVGAALLLAACGESTTAPIGDTALLSVVPIGGATDVDTNAPITMEFEHAMHRDMYAALHEGGDVSGALVDGDWAWSADKTQLTFTHAMPLNSMAEYTIHIGGGMMDADGQVIDLGQHGHDMGGEWVTQQMMDQRMMGGGGMMGFGWAHGDGTFGMVFTFTTM
jgi:hypothetical protein